MPYGLENTVSQFNPYRLYSSLLQFTSVYSGLLWFTLVYSDLLQFTSVQSTNIQSPTVCGSGVAADKQKPTCDHLMLELLDFAGYSIILSYFLPMLISD